MRPHSKKIKTAVSAGVLVVVISAVIFTARSGNHSNSASDSQTPMETVPQEKASPTVNSRISVQTAAAIKTQSAAKLSGQDFDQAWKRFQDRFGDQFRASFTSDRRLSHIRATEDSARPAENYRRSSQDAALTRANEILHEADPILRVSPAFPLQPKGIQADDISSQVEYVQTYGNVPIEPYGRVTVQLDQQGGLRGLYSNYISDPVIANEPTQNPQALKDSILSSIHFTPDHPDQISSGTLVLFAAGPQDSAATVPLNYAYRFSVDGREVFIDASTGKTLSEKDRRQF